MKKIDVPKPLAHKSADGLSATERRIIAEHYRRIGSKGGKSGTGKAKARTARQAKAAAKKRWEKVANVS